MVGDLPWRRASGPIGLPAGLAVTVTHAWPPVQREPMNYLAWTLVALAAYTVFPPLVNLAARSGRPSMVVALVASGMLATTAFGVVAYQGELSAAYLVEENAHYMYLAGLSAAVGVLSYIHALSIGPVSIVVPVFGMFIVTSSAIGVLFLSEPLTARKALGVALAVAAIYLISGQ